jgi:hypothetical protein
VNTVVPSRPIDWSKREALSCEQSWMTTTDLRLAGKQDLVARC